MEKSQSLLKSVLPSLIRNVSDWISVDVNVYLFGERVFSFTWPPKSNSKKTESHD